MKKILFLILLFCYCNLFAQGPYGDTLQVRNAINTQILTNGTKSITALQLNQIFNGMLNTYPRNFVDSVYAGAGNLYWRRNGVVRNFNINGMVNIDTTVYSTRAWDGHTLDSLAALTTLQTVTKSAASSLIASSSLVPGKYYKITGVDSALYGGTDIIVQAAAVNKFSEAGIGFFYNPRYDQSRAGFRIWTSDSTYASGDTVIWGNHHWRNKTGSVGSSLSIYRLDATNWDSIPYNTTTYSFVADPIKYNYDYNKILERIEVKADNRVTTSITSINYFVDLLGAGTNAIKAFQWGNPLNMTGNPNGIGINKITDAYIEIINFRGLCFDSNEFEVFSRVSGNTFKPNSQFYFNHFFPSSLFASNTVYDNYNVFRNIMFPEATITGNSFGISGSSTQIGFNNNNIGQGSKIQLNTFSSTSVSFNVFDGLNSIRLNTFGAGAFIRNSYFYRSTLTSNTINAATDIASNFLINLTWTSQTIGTGTIANLNKVGTWETSGLDNYTANIGSSFTSRSKVDKGYVDSIVALFVPITRTLNGLTLSANQTFAVGISGTDFAISSSGTTHTFNIPDASASNRGLVTTGTQTFAGAKTFTSSITTPSVTSSGSAPTVTVQSGAGSGASASVSGNDVGGEITLNIGTSPAGAANLDVLQFDFGDSHPATPKSITFARSGTVGVTIYPRSSTVTTTGFMWQSSTSLSSSVTVKWYYSITW